MYKITVFPKKKNPISKPDVTLFHIQQLSVLRFKRGGNIYFPP